MKTRISVTTTEIGPPKTPSNEYQTTCITCSQRIAAVPEDPRQAVAEERVAERQQADDHQRQAEGAPRQPPAAPRARATPIRMSDGREEVEPGLERSADGEVARHGDRRAPRSGRRRVSTTAAAPANPPNRATAAVSVARAAASVNVPTRSKRLVEAAEAGDPDPDQRKRHRTRRLKRERGQSQRSQNMAVCHARVSSLGARWGRPSLSMASAGTGGCIRSRNCATTTVGNRRGRGQAPRDRREPPACERRVSASAADPDASVRPPEFRVSGRRPRA